MFALQPQFKDTEKNIGRCLSLGVIGFVIIIISVIVFHINNVETCKITVVDVIELTCDVNINENAEINIYKLTVAGYLETGNIYSEQVPPVVSQSFDLITSGTIESIENIILFVYINGDMKAVKYDTAYAVLEKADMNRDST